MVKRIKILYTFTIIAILVFLGMQVYWLYLRYEYTLSQHEDTVRTTIMEALSEYRKIRISRIDASCSPITTRSSYNLNYDHWGKNRMEAIVVAQKFPVYKMLGIDEPRELTADEKERVSQMVNDSTFSSETIRRIYDVENGPSEAVVWGSMKNVDLEFYSPFTVDGIDSVLCKAGIDAQVRVEVADTMVWNPVLVRHSSLLSPKMQLTVPYSELDKKVAVFVYEIPVSAIIKEMGWTLGVVVALSVLLTLCLVWQFSTILRLNRLNRMRNMFIIAMIHELKRPLSTLKMCVSGMENERMSADKNIRGELMSNARTALDNLAAYFSRIRDITFNDVEQVPLSISSFHLSKVVADVIRAVTPSDSKKVKINNNVDPALWVTADPTHIFNIMTNLVENAIKYSGQSVDITIASNVGDDNVAISVTDNGNGIPASELSRIFKRFYRGRAADSEVPGMGLGLAYVELLAKVHGGGVTVTSVYGKGSTFTVFLPQ